MPRLIHLVPIPVVLLLAACTEYDILEGKDVGEDTAALAEVQVDTWDLGGAAGADILFFGDTSGSMAVELATLGTQVQVFLERLATWTEDWQLLAVTGPDGCGVNGVITPATHDWQALFAAGITTPPGADEVDEWGLNNVAAAVEQSDPGECNEGFVREGAKLHVVFISDEDDNSPGWDDNANYWTDYHDAILARKGDASAVVFSAVAGPVPDGCAGAEPGWGYWDVVQESGGSFISICDAWEEELGVLADTTVAWDRFALSRRPRAETLEVGVDGEARTTGWTYVPPLNEVQFAEDAPVTGQRVSIRYEVAAAE